MPSFFKSISGLITSASRHLTGTEDERLQDTNGKITYCKTAETPWFPERKVHLIVVSFNGNGGTGEMESKTIYSGFFTLPDCEFTPPSGKSFKGWAFSAEGAVITAEKIELKVNTTLYAIWDDKKYTISFNANSGYGPAGSGIMNPIVTTSPFAKPECTFTPKDGYAFKNWAKNYDAGGEPQMIRKWPLSVSANTTLYAMWEKLYKITFEANGGSGEQAPIISMPGVITLPTAAELTITPPESYTFKGWSTDSTGLAPILTEITLSSSDITLYAIWEYNDPYYHVSFLSNGGGGSQAEVKVSKATRLLSFPEPTIAAPTGKFFNGWSLDKTASFGSYPHSIKVVNGDLTYFAIWGDTKPEYTLTYDANGGTPASAQEKVPKEHPVVTVKDCMFTKPGANFVEWNESQFGGGISHAPGDTTPLIQDKTWYAIWDA